MKAIFHSFLAFLAKASDRELARHIQFLKVENEILRSKLPKRISVTRQERNRLVKFGKDLGTAIYLLVTIVSPRTFWRWLHPSGAQQYDAAKTGRPKTATEIRELVVLMAQENAWGYTRLLGESCHFFPGALPRGPSASGPRQPDTLTSHRQAPPDGSPEDVVCHERLGGLLKSYAWKAAA